LITEGSNLLLGNARIFMPELKQLGIRKDQAGQAFFTKIVFCLFCIVSHYNSYLNSTKKILSLYKGSEPFSSFIKKFFAENKKFGSRDRKQIAHLCYCYFRLGKAAINLPVEERILAGVFLSSNSQRNGILEVLKPEWNERTNMDIKKKYSMLDIQCSTIFPWKEELSDGIEHEKFCESFFVQPDLFIRIRPHHAKSVLFKLEQTGVHYELNSPFTVRLPNSFKVDQYLELDKEIVIQDYNSQQTGLLMPLHHEKAVHVWDCCTASGGKSIMAYDINSNIELTVSDKRESILINLKKRFKSTGIKKYKSVIIDLASDQQLTTNDFDLIIADVPCTGSGTWGRTPEQLFYFDERKIEEYASLQKKIISNIIPHIKPGGYLLYITCSVFKKENEENVFFTKENSGMELVKSEILKGYDKKADSLFAALFKRSII